MTKIKNFGFRISRTEQNRTECYYYILTKLLIFLSLIAFISCSSEDKMGNTNLKDGTEKEQSSGDSDKDELKKYIGSYQTTGNYSFAGYGTFKYGAKLTEYETGKYRLELTGGQYNNRKPNRDETKDKNGSMAFHDWHTFLIRFSSDGNTLYITFPTWSRPVEMKKIG